MRLLTLGISGATAALFGIGLAVLAAEADLSKVPPASNQTGVTYDKDIKPILDKSCIRCHGEKKPKGKLMLTTIEGLMKGGEDGKVVIPGNSAKSQIVLSVSRVNDDEAMPPNGKGKPLTKEQVGLIRAWIDQGAK